MPAEVHAAPRKFRGASVIARRNRLSHGYLGIDDDTVWGIVRDDLTPLRKALIALLAAKP